MNEQKLRGAIGLCARARKLSCGDFAVKRSVQMGMAYLVLIDDKASEGTAKRLRYLCDVCDTPCYTIPQSVGAARAAGRDSCLLFAVEDENLAILVENAIKADPPAGEERN
ncbi:MAG: hypothetical protein J6L88_01270 [Clostridia bacterium]|nr:hypothetical protein [Clostridia bacterium]